jgi:hypothetical protein
MDGVTLYGNRAIIYGKGALGDGTPMYYAALVVGNAPVIGANRFTIIWITAKGLFRTSGALVDGYIAVPTH